MLKLHVLASGSRGNAAVIEDGLSGRAVLVDCGITKKAFFQRCDETGFDPARIEGVLVTHEHGDHTKGLGVVLRGLARIDLHPKVFADPAVIRASSDIRQALESIGDAACEFGSGSELGIAGMDVFPFCTSHDAAASYGFRFEAAGSRDAIGFMTDTGTVTSAAHAHLQGCRILAIEGNHDLRMLEQGPYPYTVKQRIASEQGHLSNEQGAAELASLLHAGLESVVAMHVSQNNNDYELPRRAFAAALEREGHPARVLVGFQERAVSA